MGWLLDRTFGERPRASRIVQARGLDQTMIWAGIYNIAMTNTTCWRTASAAFSSLMLSGRRVAPGYGHLATAARFTGRSAWLRARRAKLRGFESHSLPQSTMTRALGNSHNRS